MAAAARNAPKNGRMLLADKTAFLEWWVTILSQSSKGSLINNPWGSTGLDPILLNQQLKYRVQLCTMTPDQESVRERTVLRRES